MRREWMLHFASADGLTGTAWLKTNPLQVFKRPIGAGNPLAMGYLDECRDRSYQLVKIDNEHGNAYYEEIVEGRNVAEMSAEIADLRDEIAGTIKVRDQAFEKIAEMTAELTRLRAELERVRGQRDRLAVDVHDTAGILMRAGGRVRPNHGADETLAKYSLRIVGGKVEEIEK